MTVLLEPTFGGYNSPLLSLVWWLVTTHIRDSARWNPWHLLSGYLQPLSAQRGGEWRYLDEDVARAGMTRGYSSPPVSLVMLCYCP